MAQTYLNKPLNFNPELAAQGFKLGMFGQNNVEPTVLNAAPKAFEVPEGVDPTTAYLISKVLPSTNPETAWNEEKKRLDYAAALAEKQAERRQKFGEESTRKALLYQSLANIGPTIAQALNPGYLMESADRIARTGNEAFRSVPSMNIQAPGYNLAQFKYF